MDTRRLRALPLPGWRWILAALVLGSVASVIGPALAQDATHTRWTTPNSSLANSLALDPSGFVWATTDRDGNGLGRMFRLDPPNDQMTTFSHDTALGDSMGAVVDGQSNVWFTSNTAGGYRINRLNPTTGETTGWPVAEAGYTVALDSLGNVWFGCRVGSPAQPALCRLTPGTNAIMDWPLASVPTSIFIDSQDKVWHVRPDAMKVGVLDPLTNSLTQWSASGTNMNDHPGTIFVTAGEVWFTVWQTVGDGGSIIRLTPGTNQMTEWSCPPGTCFAPSGIFVDGAGKVWFTELRGASFDRLDPAASPPVFTRWGIPSEPYLRGIYPDEILSTTPGEFWIHTRDCLWFWGCTFPGTPLIDRWVP